MMLNFLCVYIQQISIGAMLGTLRSMGKWYLNYCFILLLYVERCHRFGTRHLDEYAKQLRPCVIYAKKCV